MWNSLSNIKQYENLLNSREKNGLEVTSNDVDFQKLCRTCLRDAPDTDNLMKDFEIGAMSFNLDGRVLKLIDMLTESANLEVSESDKLPHQICNNCIQNVSGAYFFRLQCHKAKTVLNRLHDAMHSVSDDPEKLLFDESLATPNPDDELASVIEYEEDNIDNNDYEEIDDIKIPDKEMDIEFDGVEYKIDSEMFEMEMESDDNSESRPQTEIDSAETVTLENIKIEIIQTDGDDEKKSTKSSKSSTFRCTECHENFIKKKDFNEHIRIAHADSKFYRCEVCESRFTKAQSLKRHMKIHQGDNEKNKFCPICCKGFMRADDLRRHVRTHTGERPYACSICPKRYKQTSELKEHMLTHSRDKMFVCTICGKLLQTRNGHYVHMRTHLGIKKHICKYCSNSYVTSGELSSHIRHIHEKRKSFICTAPNCSRAFVTKVSLEIHSRTHNGDRPFECEYCGKSLATKSSLSDHVRIHTGRNRYRCDGCGKLFVTAQAFKKHTAAMQCRESGMNSADVMECTVCEKRFDTFDIFKEHYCTGNDNGDGVGDNFFVDDDEIQQLDGVVTEKFQLPETGENQTAKILCSFMKGRNFQEVQEV